MLPSLSQRLAEELLSLSESVRYCRNGRIRCRSTNPTSSFQVGHNHTGNFRYATLFAKEPGPAGGATSSSCRDRGGGGTRGLVAGCMTCGLSRCLFAPRRADPWFP
jgi:hypothetical protein